jgi:hypothetical protein
MVLSQPKVTNLIFFQLFSNFVVKTDSNCPENHRNDLTLRSINLIADAIAIQQIQGVEFGQSIERCAVDMEQLVADKADGFQVPIIFKQIARQNLDIVESEPDTTELRKWLEVLLSDGREPAVVDVDPLEVVEDKLESLREVFDSFVVHEKHIDVIFTPAILVG